MVTDATEETAMKIVVTGATGVLGRRVLPLLADAGHGVTAVARGKADAVRAAGAIPTEVDLFDPAAVTRMVDGHDAVVDLATRIPSVSDMARRSAWRDNDRLRRDASAIMADAILATGATRHVRESYFGVFADGGDGPVTEDSPVDPAWPARTALDAEASTDRVTAGGGVGVALRFGQFYAADAGHTQAQVALARRGIAPFLGDPDGYLPALHVDDAASAVVAALDAPAGTWVVADDAPATRRVHAAVLGSAVGRELRVLPRLLTRVGPLKAQDRSIRLDASAFRAATGWAPTVSTVHAGWHRIVADLDGDTSDGGHTVGGAHVGSAGETGVEEVVDRA